MRSDQENPSPPGQPTVLPGRNDCQIREPWTGGELVHLTHTYQFPIISGQHDDAVKMSADIYWITNVPGGRLAILGRPRAGDWLCDEIADWKAPGVTDVISLLQSHEIRELGLTREVEI